MPATSPAGDSSRDGTLVTASSTGFGGLSSLGGRCESLSSTVDLHRRSRISIVIHELSLDISSDESLPCFFELCYPVPVVVVVSTTDGNNNYYCSSALRLRVIGRYPAPYVTVTYSPPNSSCGTGLSEWIRACLLSVMPVVGQCGWRDS
jgi:hypothetical protein